MMAGNSRGSLYSDYGGVGSNEFGAEQQKQRVGPSFHAQSIGLLTMPPLLMYAFMDITFATLAGILFPLACLFAALCIANSILFAWVHKNNVKGPIYLYLSVLCFIATFCGIWSGLSIHARFYSPYFQYKNRPTYTDVLPTDPAAARADGSVIGFSSNAVVDTVRIGNMLDTDGNRYCVAPIFDESQQAVAEFWAVGVNCCAGHVSFHCDDAQNLQAKSGAVVFDPESDFALPLFDKFHDAVKQASARYGIKIPKKPVLVRWFLDPQTVTKNLWWDGTLHLTLGILFYSFISLLIATGLHMVSSASK